MKLRLLHESSIPPSLRGLSKAYWRLRHDVLQTTRRGVEPYICNTITRSIGEWLQAHGFNVQYVKGYGRLGPHVWLKASDQQGTYEIDGSAYQYYYDKPITTKIGDNLGTTLTKLGFSRLCDVLALIDYRDGLGLAWTNTGEYGIDHDEDRIAQVSEKLRDGDIEKLKGKLLPFLLSVNQVDRGSSFQDIRDISQDQMDF